ncbi:MAG TPA: hypothetical protein PKI14_19445 [Fervidobacterium sp.]|nr:hypothetical protein [Fervidobacterium sp.]
MADKTMGDLGLWIPRMNDSIDGPDGTIEKHLPENFQKIDEEFTTHKAENVTVKEVHGLKIETGTWTPVLEGFTTGGTQTYSKQFGRYTKENKKVTLVFNLALTAKDPVTTDALVIRGIPFAADSAFLSYKSPVVLTNTVASIENAHIYNGLSHLALMKENSVNIGPSEINNTFSISGEITYYTV